MNNRAEMDFDGVQGARSRRGWGFAAGVLVGLAGAIAGLALAVAAQRRARRPRKPDAPATLGGSEPPENWQAEQDELDEELAQTFPASDPLPQSHRVD
jgi:hypothetical protein